MIRTEITGAEIAEEMEKERRIFQLQMCEVSMEYPQHGFPVPLVLSPAGLFTCTSTQSRQI